MAKSLTELLNFLNRLPGRGSLTALTAELADLAVDLQDLRPHVKFSDRTYRRNLVHAGPWHHLLVLCWRNGQRSPIHDHRGSACAVRVLQGVMTETLFSVAANGLIRAESSRDLGPGGVIGSVDGDMHQVSNLQAGGADLVTLHIYSPPLMMMGTYSLTDRLRGEEPMFLDFGEAEGI
jgi:cysteine dioxygenase